MLDCQSTFGVGVVGASGYARADLLRPCHSPPDLDLASATVGRYPTAAALVLAPLAAAGVIERAGIIVDAASGVSGAGRALKHSTHFGTANEDFTAYGLLDHRHTSEMEQSIGGTVLFTPH